ncbi:MAG: cobalt ECF transporter T component CbiQ [Acidimicrobiia bacterium]|nr:cobalt ECF transporter T component CbiQ [Acidimicrobiia bacterium]
MYRPTLVEHWARRNRWAHRHPGEKAFVALLAVALAVTHPSPLVSLLVAGTAVAIVTAAPIPVRVSARVVLGPLLFLLALSVPVAVTMSFEGGVRLAVTGDDARKAMEAMARASGALMATSAFALTTPVQDLGWLLRRVGVSPTLVDVLLGIVRFMFSMEATLHTLVAAQRARAGFRGWHGRVRSTGCVAGALFARTLQRASGMELGMRARGGVPLDRGDGPPPSWRLCGIVSAGLGAMAVLPRILG